jgi:hypothetical protein
MTYILNLLLINFVVAYDFILILLTLYQLVNLIFIIILIIMGYLKYFIKDLFELWEDFDLRNIFVYCMMMVDLMIAFSFILYFFVFLFLLCTN